MPGSPEFAVENIEKKIAIKRKEINTASTTYEGNFEDGGRRFTAISNENYSINFPYDSPEDGVCSSQESLKRASLASRKHKKTKRTRLGESQYVTKGLEKQRNPIQSASSSESGDGSECSIWNTSDVSETSSVLKLEREAEWLISKLEQLQESLDKQLKKAADKLCGGPSSFMQSRRTLRELSSDSQSDLFYTAEGQASLTNSATSISSTSSSGEGGLDMQSQGSRPRPLTQPANSPPLLSPPATVTSESLSSHLPTFLSKPASPVSPKCSPPTLFLHPAITGRRQDADSEKAGEDGQISPKFRRIDRVWDALEQKFTMKKLTVELKQDIAQDDECIFVVLRDFNYGKNHIENAVEVKNSLFKECLQKVMGNIAGVNFAEENPKLDPKTLFL
jgi:hypothetical protein